MFIFGESKRVHIGTVSTPKLLGINWNPRLQWFHGKGESGLPHNCPKYRFIASLAIHNRRTTGDRMLGWNSNIDSACVLCQTHLETHNPMFFSCAYSQQVWINVAKRILPQDFSSEWNSIFNKISWVHQNRLRGLSSNIYLR